MSNPQQKYTSQQKTALDLVNDSTIKLPRFQRKKSWKPKDRFILCISLFKGYPLGSFVLKNDVASGKKLLLDGRQRLDTLNDMQNPECVFRWAMKSGIKASDIRGTFNEQMSEFLYYDESEDSNGSGVNKSRELEVKGEFDIDSDSYYEENEIDSGPNFGDTLSEEDSNQLEDLLEVLETVGKITKGSSNFTKPFDFKIDGFSPAYMDRDSKKVDPLRLTRWIKGKLEFEDYDNITTDIVLGCFDSPPVDVRRRIEVNLKSIKASIKCVKMIQHRLRDASIPVIQLDDNCSQSDAQKIFELINSKGVQLTPAEILSASSSWNRQVREPNPELFECVQKLYGEMDIPKPEDVVIWDVVATFHMRLPESANYIFGDKFERDATKLDKKITSGFKLYAGRYCQTIDKNSLDAVSECLINWNSSEFENEISKVCDFLAREDSIIYMLNSYRRPLKELTSEAVSMCYILVLINEYNEITNKGEKGLLGANKKTFILKSRVLLDRLFYEYCMGQWKGSSDSRLKRNLKNTSEMFRSVGKEDWDSLIDNLYEDNVLNGSRPLRSNLDPLIIYLSAVCLKHNSNPEPVQIDHIIPDSEFTQNCENYEFKDSFVNLALLPASLNLKKSNDLNIDAVKRDLIARFEDISPESVGYYTTPGKYLELKEERRKMVEDVKQKRDEFVRGEGCWTIKIR